VNLIGYTIYRYRSVSNYYQRKSVMKRLFSILIFIFGGIVSAQALTSDIDIQRVIVRGTIAPAAGELRTVSRVYFTRENKATSDIHFIVSKGRRIVSVFGPDGEGLSFQTSSLSIGTIVMTVQEITVTLPPFLLERDSLFLTFLIDGTVEEEGFYERGIYVSQSGLALMGDALYPQIGTLVEGNDDDPFLWLELELSTPEGWLLATGGFPEQIQLTNQNLNTTTTELTDRSYSEFLNDIPNNRIRHHWKKIGVNIGLFYIYGGENWIQRDTTQRGVHVRVYTHRNDSDMTTLLLEDMTKMLPVMIDSLGPFPFPEFTIVMPPRMIAESVAGGVDSWAMYTIPHISKERLPAMRETCVHEVIHAYWDQALRTPEEENLALCEPFASYLDVILKGAIFKDTLANLMAVNNRRSSYYSYYRSTRLYHERSLSSPSFLDPYTLTGLYSKGALVVAMLADLVGPEEFRKLQYEVFRAGEGRFYSLDSLQDGISRHTSYPTQGLINDLFVNGTIYDYGIDDVTTETAGNDSIDAHIAIDKKKKGGHPMLLRVTFGDSSTVTRRIDGRVEHQTLTVRGPKPFQTAEIDPDYMTLDADRYNNVYPRISRYFVTWGRHSYDHFPSPLDDWGEIGTASRRFYFNPVIDYTDFDGMRYGVGMEMRRTYTDKFYGWGAWSTKQQKLRGEVGYVFFPKQLDMLSFAATYHDDGLFREATVTSFLPSVENWIACAVSVGYEERPSSIRIDSALDYDLRGTSIRLVLHSPLLRYMASMMSGDINTPLTLSFKKCANLFGGTMDYTYLEGDTRLVFYPLSTSIRWGISGGVDHQGEGFLLGGSWGNVDDRIRTVLGYPARWVKNYVLLNTSFAPVHFPYGSVFLSLDLADCKNVFSDHHQFLLGYGIGIRYWLPSTDWLESMMVRLQYGAPKEGISKGYIYAGFEWEF